MAKIFYDIINGGLTLAQYCDAQQVQRADLETERDQLLEVASWSDTTRTLIAQNGLPSIGLPNFVGQPDPLAAFDTYIDAELDRIRDILDYFDYEKDAPPIGNVVSGDWFLPEAVESFTDETVGGEAANAIDAVNGGDPDPNDPESRTYWQSESSGTRQITVRLRSYTKRVEGIRLRTNNGDLRAALQGLTVRASNALAMIDDPDNIQRSGINIDGLPASRAGTPKTNPWTEINFVKAKCRYIKLEMTGGLRVASLDTVRIRSLQVRVGVTNHDK